jgi:VRR-NUC domain
VTELTKPPLATGGMSIEGTTTVVKMSRPDIDSQDKKVLCWALCQCDKAPNIGKDGQQLKQACVSEMLKAVDKQLGHKSPYKQEINYDMTKNPPEPIMDSGVPTKGHDWLPGWIEKHWPTKPYTPGEGLIRRPDVVIVNDPSKPPTQDNIKQIVEMKFPPDEISERQARAYQAIAGDPKKLEALKPSDCDCDQSGPEPPSTPVESMDIVSKIIKLIMLLFGGRRMPHPR